MEKPNIKDYNLTEELIERLKKSDARNKKFLLFIPIILVLAYTIFEAARSVSPDYGLLTYIIPFYGILGVVGGAILGGILVGAYSTLAPYLSPHRANLIKFEDAKDKYEEPIIGQQVDFWRNLNDEEFKLELAGLFEKKGYRVSTGDKGIDLVIAKDGKTKIVQCKSQKKPLEIGLVRDLYGKLMDFGADEAILASLSGFGRGVKEFTKDKPIQLMDVTDIIIMQDDFLQP